MSDMNACAFSGRVGQQPELRTTGGGTPVLSISFAVGGRKKVGETWTDTTTWLSTAVFGKRAEALSKLISKGSRIGVQGKLEVREYDDKNGVKRQSVEVFADDIVLLDGKRDGGQRDSAERPAYGPGATDDTDIPFAPWGDIG